MRKVCSSSLLHIFHSLSISSAKCPKDQQLTLTKNRRNQLKRDLDSIDEEIKSQDSRLVRFDERTQALAKKGNAGGLMAQLIGASSGRAGGGAEAREEYNRTRKAARDQRERERGNLQDTVLRNKILLTQQRMSLEDRLLTIDYDIQILSVKTTCRED